MPKVKKHKPVLAAKQSITKKPATGTQHKNRKPHQQPPQQQSARPSKPAPVRPKAPRAGHAAAWPAGQWRCASVIDQQSAEALLRLLSAAETRTAGATIKSLTLAPHIVHKKPTYAVTVETLKHLPLLKALLAAAGLLQQHQQVGSDAAESAGAACMRWVRGQVSAVEAAVWCSSGAASRSLRRSPLMMLQLLSATLCADILVL